MIDDRFDEELLRVGTEAHYEDAAYYDRCYRRRREDVRFYTDIAVSQGSTVLELGCGTGRVLLALAEAGIDVVGVDSMAPMLERLRTRIGTKPRRVRDRITLRRGDLRSVRLQRRFDLVIAPFNVFMHLYRRRDVERALATVAAHLRRGGRFVFDVMLPDPGYLARNPERVYRAGTVTLPESGRRYRYRERFDYDDVQQVQLVEMAFVGVDDPSDFRLMPLAHRQFFPAELEALLHYNGFRIRERYGDFERGPLEASCESQIIVASRRGR